MNSRKSQCPVRRGRFVNPHQADSKRSIWDVILWKFGFFDDHKKLSKMPDEFSYPIEIKQFDRDRNSAVWIGHSTYLIHAGKLKIITDPVWSQYCSPVHFRGLKRHINAPFPIESIGPLDIALISHNHYDHLDLRSVQTLAAANPHMLWVIPKGLSRWFRRLNIESICELEWWESITHLGHRITAVPAQHFSGRTLWDQNRTLWNGYVVESKDDNKKFYFVGDTGYNPYHFKEIGKQFAPIDLSLIPIGTYLPRRFMEPVHSSPRNAVAIHQDVGSKLSLGMHWKTFHLSDEPLDRPPYDLFLAMQEQKVPLSTFLPIDIGVFINW